MVLHIQLLHYLAIMVLQKNLQQVVNLLNLHAAHHSAQTGWVVVARKRIVEVKTAEVVPIWKHNGRQTKKWILIHATVSAPAEELERGETSVPRVTMKAHVTVVMDMDVLAMVVIIIMNAFAKLVNI